MSTNKSVARPLEFENAQRTGAYRLVSRVSESVLNPGDTLKIDQYITGYGENAGIKIVSYPSNELFDEKASSYKWGLMQSESEGIKWGRDTGEMQNCGFSITASMMQNKLWDRPAAIFDTSKETNFVFTERTVGSAPFSYNLKLRKNATPGPHYIVFNMTYFNGSEWVCQEEKINFRVNNKFEEHSAILSTLAAIALIVTIFHDGVWPLLESLHEFSKSISHICSS